MVMEKACYGKLCNRTDECQECNKKLICERICENEAIKEKTKDCFGRQYDKLSQCQTCEIWSDCEDDQKEEKKEEEEEDYA